MTTQFRPKVVADVVDFVKKVKLTELENKILDSSKLATKTALTALENEIPCVSNFVKKTQNITLRLQKLKINLKIIIMKNILILQYLIN